MISIVTAYHNRRDLFINTLDSIEQSKIKDYEIIVVDDCSNDENRLEDLISIYPKLKIIRIEKVDKWWVNPCINFNIGFKEAKGDIIILQNPECKHYGDILEKSLEINDNNYFSFACYSIDEDTTYNKKELVINNRPASNDGDLSWYNHNQFRPKGYHFCSVITKKNLNKLGGFDERYAMGIAYDDDEFIFRVTNLPLQVSIINYPFVIHQWHKSVNYNHLDATRLIQNNKELYFNNTLNGK